MDSTKLSSLLLILTIFISTTPPILGCGYCTPPKTKPPHHHTKPPKSPGSGRPVLPPVHKPPISLPPVIGKPPVTLPPIIGKPPVTLPPVVGPVVPALPPVTVPPVIPPGAPNCPPGAPTPVVPVPVPAPAPPPTCPIDTLKLGACVDLLGGLVHVIIGDPAVNQCCPVIQGLAELEAAVCLCTTIKLKLLNINLYLPLALQLLLNCGKPAPPGFTCSI